MRGEAVQDGHADLGIRALTIEVLRHKALTRQFRYANFGSHSASWFRRGFGGDSRYIDARSCGRRGVMRAGPRCGRLPRGVSGFQGLPLWILRQTSRFVPPCLRAFHSPSPSILMPPRRLAWTGGACRLDVDQEMQRACEPRYGMFTFRVF